MRGTTTTATAHTTLTLSTQPVPIVTIKRSYMTPKFPCSGYLALTATTTVSGAACADCTYLWTSTGGGFTLNASKLQTGSLTSAAITLKPDMLLGGTEVTFKLTATHNNNIAQAGYSATTVSVNAAPAGGSVLVSTDSDSGSSLTGTGRPSATLTIFSFMAVNFTTASGPLNYKFGVQQHSNGVWSSLNFLTPSTTTAMFSTDSLGVGTWRAIIIATDSMGASKLIVGAQTITIHPPTVQAGSSLSQLVAEDLNNQLNGAAPGAATATAAAALSDALNADASTDVTAIAAATAARESLATAVAESFSAGASVESAIAATAALTAKPEQLSPAAVTALNTMMDSVLASQSALTKETAGSIINSVAATAAAPPPPAPAGQTAEEKAMVEAVATQALLDKYALVQQKLLSMQAAGAPPVSITSDTGTTATARKLSSADALTKTAAGCGLKILGTATSNRRSTIDLSVVSYAVIVTPSSSFPATNSCPNAQQCYDTIPGQVKTFKVMDANNNQVTVWSLYPPKPYPQTLALA